MTPIKSDFDIVMSKSWQWQDSDNRNFEILDSDKTMTIRKFDSQKNTMTSHCHDCDSDWQWQCLVHCHADPWFQIKITQTIVAFSCEAVPWPWIIAIFSRNRSTKLLFLLVSKKTHTFYYHYNSVIPLSSFCLARIPRHNDQLVLCYCILVLVK